MIANAISGFKNWASHTHTCTCEADFFTHERPLILLAFAALEAQKSEKYGRSPICLPKYDFLFSGMVDVCWYLEGANKFLLVEGDRAWEGSNKGFFRSALCKPPFFAPTAVHRD